MTELIFVDNKGKQSYVKVPDHCNVELIIRDGQLVKARMDKDLDFISLKTSKNVVKTTKKSVIR